MLEHISLLHTEMYLWISKIHEFIKKFVYNNKVVSNTFFF